jgi:hypothetical protein
MNREKLWLSPRKDDRRFAWVTVTKKLAPGQLRVRKSINEMSNYDSRFLMVIGNTGEEDKLFNMGGYNRVAMKWLVLKSDGELVTEDQLALENMFLVMRDDEMEEYGKLGT